MNPVNRRAIVVVFGATLILLHGFMLWNARHLIAKGYPDFTIFYSAARAVKGGFGSSLYDPALQYRVQREFASGVSIRQGALPYNHPPFETLIFIPLTGLPYLAAYLTWNAVSMVLLVAVLWCLQIGLQADWPKLMWGMFACLAFFPICVALLQGQDIILLLLCFAAAYVCLKRRCDLAAGCFLGLGLFRFQLVLPFIFILALVKRGRTLYGFLGVACTLGLISAVIVGWHGLLGYPRYVWFIERTMGHGAIVPSDMPNLRGLLAALFTARISKTVLDVITLLFSLALAIFTAFRWKPAFSGKRFDLAFSLSIVVVVLVSYHAFAYDLCLLLLPVALVVNYVRGRPELNFSRRCLLVSPILVLFFSPLQMLLWLRYGQLNVLAILLAFWAWGINRELSHVAEASKPLPSTAS